MAIPKTPPTETARHGDSSVAAVEIKVTVKPDEELKAVRAMELNEDSAEVRIIYFYDTPKLKFFNAGTVLRARLVKGDDDDSTVKVRPIDPAKVSEEWRNLEGFKVEADWMGKKIVRSASLTVRQKRDEIDEVAKGKRPVYKLFDRDQVRFMAEFHDGFVDFEKLKPLGPIRVLRWEVKHKGFPYELTAEEWRLPNGDDLFEVSIKVAPDQAAEASKAFEAHLRELGIDPKGAQETKTRTALQYFVKNLKTTKA